MKNDILAYLAGAIDSDGTIGIKRSTYAMRVTRDSAQPAYSERMALRQVQRTIPDLLRRTFGGGLYITKSSARNGQALWSWSITDRRCAEALAILLPFLRIKRAQARNALRLRALKERSKAYRVRSGRGHAGSSPRSARHSTAMEARYLEAKRLNHVGI